MKTSFLTRIAYVVAIALALFSGAISTYGLTKFAPGAELVIAVMGLLFEAVKITAFSLLHHRMPALLKGGLLTIGLVLLILNIVGVSGFLSNAYEREQVAAHAVTHSAEAEAAANVTTLERLLKAAEARVTEATAAMGKARGDRDQIKAVNAVILAAAKERDALAEKLRVAQGQKAKAEGSTIQASAEFVAVAFLAAVTTASEERVAHFLLLGIASIPDIAAVLLLLAAGYTRSTETEPVPVPVVTAPALAPKAQAALTSKEVTHYKRLKTEVRKLRQREKARKSPPPRLVRN